MTHEERLIKAKELHDKIKQNEVNISKMKLDVEATKLEFEKAKSIN